MPKDRQYLSPYNIGEVRGGGGRETHWDRYLFVMKLVHLGFHIQAINSGHKRKTLPQPW